MVYVMDEERTLEAFGRSSMIDLMNGSATLYAVACIGNDEEHFSHGGQLTDNAHEALQVAREQNAEEQAPGGTGCRYLAIAVGLHPGLVMKLGNLIFGDAEYQEPGSDELG